MRHDSHGRTATLKYTLYHATMTKTLTAPPIVANTRRLADSRASRLASLARPRLARTPRLMSRLAHAPRNRCRTAPRSAHIAARAAARGRRASNPATHLHRHAPRSLRVAPCASLLAPRPSHHSSLLTERAGVASPPPDNKHKNSVRGRARRWAKCGRSSNSPVDG